jgi:hypothetical protein
MNPSRIGDIGELAFAKRCMEWGLNVSFPFSASSRYDCIVDGNNGKLWRVQVKTTQGKKDRRKQTGSRYTVCLGGGTANAIYERSEIDLIAAYLMDKDRFYLFWRKIFEGKARIHIYEGGKYDDYIETFNFL